MYIGMKMVLVVMKVVMVVVMVVMMVVMVMNVMVTLNQQESADPGTPSVAAAIKDIKKAIQVNHPYIQVNHTYFALSTSFIVNIFQSAKTLHPIFNREKISVGKDVAPNGWMLEPSPGPLAAKGGTASSVSSGFKRTRVVCITFGLSQK